MRHTNNFPATPITSPPAGSQILPPTLYVDEGAELIGVRDRGRAIPADKLEHIFDRFRQGDASDSRAMGGTGLGLAICRSIINQHGGRIWATSVEGQGTIFHFTLPTRPANNLL